MKLCIKCGEEGHTNKVCKNPVTSFGIIVYTKGSSTFLKGRMYPFTQVPCINHSGNAVSAEVPSRNNEILFLLVERKDTVGFLNLVQGAYPDIEPFKSKKIAKYIYELTCEERLKLCTWDFTALWKIAGSKKKDFTKCYDRFVDLNIKDILMKRTCFHQEGDYLMPKGRLKFGESVKQCAIREFSEETGYTKEDIEILNVDPFEEKFTGTDGKIYRNVFFVGRLKKDVQVSVKLGEDPNQTKEVRNLGWFNITECLKLLRDYHQDKKNILLQVHNILLANGDNLTPLPPSNIMYSSYISKIPYNSRPSNSYSSPQNRDGYWRPHAHRFVGDSTSVSIT